MLVIVGGIISGVDSAVEVVSPGVDGWRSLRQWNERCVK
jgi:hypothetical protein